MANLRSLCTNFISLLLFLLLHLGCFTIFPSNHHHHHYKKRKPKSPLPLHVSASKFKPQKAWTFLKRIFSSNSKLTPTHPNSLSPSPASSTISVVPPASHHVISDYPTRRRRPGSLSESDIFFPLRNDIYPCPNCGEIFQNPVLLEQHQSFKHAVSELLDDDPGKNIVSIIFSTGWPGSAKNPKIYRVLKIHNSPKILTRFEEYRESVKANAAVRRRDERCIADGNELLRFHCATFLCDLGQNGNSSICNHQYCSVCGIIRAGFSSKMDGISTLSKSWKAHVAIPEDIEEEFKFMNLKRAMLVCRVIAGRVGCESGLSEKDDPGYDSLVGREAGVHRKLDEEDELLVFNPRAVLPCFVIAYTV